MSIEFTLPEVSEGVESADVASILVSEGDTVAEEQVVMEFETEKAVVELPCPHAGTITKVHVAEGDSVAIGAPLLTIEPGDGTPKEDASSESKPAEAPAPSESTEAAAPAAKPEPAPTAAVPPTTTAASTSEGTVLATTAESKSGGPPPPAAPSTRRLARKLGVDLHVVKGSARGGRITVEDVQEYVRSAMSTGGNGAVATVGAAPGVTTAMAAPPLPDFTKFGPVVREPMNKIARTSANNLSYAWNTIPHVTQHDLVDVTDIEAARKQYMNTLGKNGPKITMTAVAAKACVTCLKAFPKFNSSIDLGSGELVLKQYYHVGIAVDTPNGLLVPVVKDCDKKSVVEIAEDITDLAVRARDRKVSMDELQGATFTITNLGGIGGTSFTPIVNPPEVAILGMSRYQKTPALVDGQLVNRLILPLSLSYDHRVVNGADAARFIVKLNHALSNFFALAIEG